MADYRAAARRAAKKHGLDPGIFERQIQQESGFDPDVRSSKGATGIAQIMPDTARGWGVDPLDPIASLDAAAKNMASYVKKYGGYENALRAYNAGPGAIEQSKGYPETNHYVDVILGGKTPPKTTSAPTAAALQTLAQTSSVTTGGQTPIRALAERVRPTITGPALPDYVRRPPPTIAVPDRSDPQRLLRARAATLGNVPQTTTDQTIAPQTTTAAAASDPQTGAPTSGAKGSKVLELIFNDGGKGYGIKKGQTVDGPSFYSGVWAGHADHVHVAAGPKTVVALGKYAQSLGLHVGENSHFGGVHPVHTAGSYHDDDEAIDVSAPMSPAGIKKMSKFAKYVADYNRTRDLPASP